MCALCEDGWDCPRHPRENPRYFLEPDPSEVERERREEELSRHDFEQPWKAA
jgi:hypothetical protein